MIAIHQDDLIDSLTRRDIDVISSLEALATGRRINPLAVESTSWTMRVKMLLTMLSMYP